MSSLGVTQYGAVSGRSLPSGATAWLGVPYALPTPRWTATRPLPRRHRYERTDYSEYGPQAAQPALWLLPMSAFVAFFATRWLKRAALANDQAMLGPPEQLFSEDCLTLDIYAPKGTTATSLLPVTVYIHGGYLQTGSPSCHLNNPSKLIDVDEPRIWVCVTYRLSVFGFLANPAMGANWGFLDQWTALQWVQENISAFGGDPQQVTLMGQSAGAHSTQQLVHHASRLSDDVPIPFQSAHMISNGVASQPKSLLEAQAQYDAFAHQLGIDPEAPDSLDRLRDVPTAQVIAAVEALGPKGAFRGITDNVIVHEFMLEWQSSGRLAKALARKGFRRLIIGETVEEDLGGICPSYQFLCSAMASTYGSRIGEILVRRSGVNAQSSVHELETAQRAILSDMQIHLGSRRFARALWRQPEIGVVRYQIAWAPKRAIPLVSRDGITVSHCADMAVWFHRSEYMTAEDERIAMQWRAAIRAARRAPSERHQVALKPMGEIAVEEDVRWRLMEELEDLLEWRRHAGSGSV